MILSEPGRTSYDWNFSIFGFDVRVHPLFFVIPGLLFYRAIPLEINTGAGLLIVIAIFFVSILVHELGHAIAFRYYGVPSRIVLYWMGGLAIPDSGGAWSSSRTRSLNPSQQIIVSLAGPVFGLLLAGVFALLVVVAGGSLEIYGGGMIPLVVPVLKESIFSGSVMLWMAFVFYIGIFLNIFMNLLNLLPVYPLDGGQVTRQIMIQMYGQNGVKNSLYVSIAVSITLAVYFFVELHAQFAGIFFAYMAWSSYQSLQSYQRPRW